MRRQVALCAGLLLLALSVVPRPPSPLWTNAAAGSADPFGVLFSVGATVSADTIDRMFAEAQGLGVGWVRTDFFWDVIEPERGVFRWTVPDRIVQTAEAHSIQLLGILDYSARWASSDLAGLSDKYPPRQISDFARYVVAAVSRYRGTVSYWQVWNEPDIHGFWRGSAEQYAELLIVSYHAVKAANPASWVVLGGLAQGGDHQPAFLDRVLTVCRQRGEPCFDIMAFHTNFRTLRAIRDQFDRNRRTLAQYGFDRPIWITESSYTSDPRFQTVPGYEGGEASQARYLEDALTLSMSLGAQRVFWAELSDYNARDAAAGGLAAYASSGLLRSDGWQKPAYLTYQRLRRQIVDSVRSGVEPGDEAGRP